MQYLGAGWLIIRIIQPHQRVAQEGRKARARRLQLRRRSGRLDDFGEIGAHLQLCVPADIHRGRPGYALAGSEDGPRQFEFAQRRRQRQKAVANGGAVGHFTEAIVESEERIERHQPLVVEHGAHAAGNLLMHTRAFRAVLRGPGQQIHHLALGEIGFAPCRHQDGVERLARGVEELGR